MIEGNFKDVSLPNLLQFLGAEVSKNYRVRVCSEGQTGEIYVCRGFVVSACFGLLEGEDAMCEFLGWRNGSFFVETLTLQVEVKKNLKRAIQPGNAFIENSQLLAERKVGLNTVIVASKLFGTHEWQDSLRLQPLEREDFVVLGWVGDGRTMRQALREFSFDIAQATGILARLLRSDSVQVLRPSTGEAENAGGATDEEAVVQRFVSTGGQSEAAASVAQAAARAYAQEAAAAVAQDAFISTSFKSVVSPSTDAKAQKQGNPLLNPIKKIGVDLAQVRASMEARLRSRGSGRRTGEHPVATANQDVEKTFDQSRHGVDNPGSSMIHSQPVSQSAANQEGGAAPLNFADSAAQGTALPATDNGAQSGLPTAPPAHLSGSDFESLTAEPSQPFAQPYRQPQQLVEPETFKLQQQSKALADPGQTHSFEESDQYESPPLHSWTIDEDESPHTVSAFDSVDDLIPPLPSEGHKVSGLGKLLAQANQSAGQETVVPPEVCAQPIDPNTPARKPQTNQASLKVIPDAAAPNVRQESEMASVPPRARTEALPMVTIDIDRLLKATFTPTQFGKLALTNPSLDQHRRQTLLDVESGQTLRTCIEEENRPPAAILSSFRYCLERGYIESHDSVVPLTADLLLGRMEIDQYLLQRRRLTGDQLRDLVEIARNEAVKLSQVLVRSGYLTLGDLQTLEREQKRFAFK